MSATATASLTALLQRLEVVAGVLHPAGPGGSPTPEDAPEAAGELLRRLVEGLTTRPARDEVWLLLVGLSATFPLDDEVRAAQRQLELGTVDDCCVWLLEQAYTTARDHGSGAATLELAVDEVVVDVDFTATHDLQTGMQRVVRRLLPRWHRDHTVTLVVWTAGGRAWRRLDDAERYRVLHWDGPRRGPAALPAEPLRVLVPWRSTVVLPEVPRDEQCQRMAALAQHSGNRVAVVGYDCIPVVVADLLPAVEAVKFVRYLALVKHCRRVVAISESAAAEFRGFCRTLSSQGLVGPDVSTCALALDAAAVDAVPAPSTVGSLPEVLVVGSHEPRKNHLAVLHAAEVLWREGKRFSVRFLGGSGWSTTAFDHRLAVLRRAGRPVAAERGLGDAALWDAFQRARFTVFPSLHEGFGLPVAESLAFGTPVVGTGYGSVGELAGQGGVLTVDPRDDEDLTRAMRLLLDDDDALTRLREQALQRPVRTWDDYARELWHLAVDDL